MDTCPVCGLPQNICVCKQITKEQQKIKIFELQRKFKNFVTIVKGIEDKETAKKVCKDLKMILACGGTMRENEIELQGKHGKKVKAYLLKEGFKEGLIEN